ncbi:MAG: 3-oxosteroid 1-dehydrogenase [Mycobacterium sp.]|nr:3-oxosteroid 1-dehydrogenase [Mycobacterium sp.]
MTTESNVDVIVLGSGAAGLAGALRAALLGQTVVVLEKSPMWGGSAAMSAGAVWVPNNSKMGQVGIDDTDAEAWAYLEAVTEGQVSAEQRRAFIDGANRMIATFERETDVRFEPVLEYPDYDGYQPGAKPGGRPLEPLPFDGNLLGEDFATLHPCYPGELIFDRFMMRLAEARALMQPGIRPKLGLVAGLARYARRSGSRRRWKGRDPYLTLGQALMARLRAELKRLGVPVRLNTVVRQLVTEHGRVVGVELASGELIRAHKGVLVATGGFERNEDLRKRYQPLPVEARWTVGHEGNTGDGILLAELVGADLDAATMDNCWWTPAVLPPGEPTAWVLVIEKSLPWSFFVDRDGRRFVNEASNYNNIGKAMYRAHAETGKAIPAWMIFDAKYRKKFPIGPVKPGMLQPDGRVPERLRPGHGWLHKADTLAALAAEIDVPAANLAATVQRFNEFARRGEDLDFHRGATLNDVHYTDPRVKPNPSLGPIDKGPFYAVQVVPGDLGTKSGLRTDTSGRVLDTDGSPIGGLYAAGNVTVSVMGPSYPGAGGTLAPAMTFAFLAVEAMASDIPAAKRLETT